MLLVTCCF